LFSVLQARFEGLSKILPSTWVSICMRGLSRRYSVAFTEITSKNPSMTHKTVWGAEVLETIYFQPTQANISISLCLNEYGNRMILSVTADAQLAPTHSVIVKSFEDDIKKLADAIEFK